jgi:hypothetical protein
MAAPGHPDRASVVVAGIGNAQRFEVAIRTSSHGARSRPSFADMLERVGDGVHVHVPEQGRVREQRPARPEPPTEPATAPTPHPRAGASRLIPRAPRHGRR